jgi:hypothetical protein
MYLLVERICEHICRLLWEFLLLRQTVSGLELGAENNNSAENGA